MFLHLIKITTLSLCLSGILFSLSAQAELPKEVLQDQYMLSLMQSLKAKNYNKALPIFKKLEALKVPLSKSFYYFKGEALAKTNQSIEAEKVIHKYINLAGKKGKFYRNSLAVLVKIEPTLEKEKKRIEEEEKKSMEEKEVNMEIEQFDAEFDAAFESKGL